LTRAVLIEYARAIYHVTSRGNERKDIFFRERDREHSTISSRSSRVRSSRVGPNAANLIEQNDHPFGILKGFRLGR